jgi:DNA-binding MarR family transcriptional regulator
MDEALAVVGLTTPQYAVLAALEEEAGLSNAELARRSFVTPQSMIRVVAGLEQRQLITRHRHEGNARVLDADLTRRGRAVVSQAHTIVAEIESTMLADVDPGDITTATRALAVMAANLE